MAATPVNLFCPGCCTACECCDVLNSNALKWIVTANMDGVDDGTCSRCSAVNIGWRRSLWKTLCKDTFGCSYTSLFEQNGSTLLCSGVNTKQGARMSILCSTFDIITMTLELLYHPVGSTPPSSMNVAATYSAVFPGVPMACNGAFIQMDLVSSDGQCLDFPTTIQVLGDPSAC